MRPAFVVFAAAAVAQWFLPLAGVWQHERVLAHGVPLRIRCSAPDPYDPLRGRFLTVRPEQDRAAAPAGMSGTGPIWATLEAGADGLARIASLSIEPISGPNVIRLVARTSGMTDGTPSVSLTWPFDRFYLNERLAPGADALVAERVRDGQKPVAEIRLLDGRAVLTDVFIDGVPIREVVKRRAK